LALTAKAKRQSTTTSWLEKEKKETFEKILQQSERK
jgi:hypothetical protein